VSTQSKVIPGRQFLEEKLRELETKFPGEDVPLPPYWGGYIIALTRSSSGKGRPNRLHDRLRYSRQPDHTWKIERLSP